ncbi:MAG: hypothetical protein Ct9H300mP28_37380 [Pseudomonadota bacterium]|nr:MAG: hypothetical protein Ct9H300mP28_37380 [Pseudomonadota bacterium]
MQEMASEEPPVPIDELTLLRQLESRQQLEQTGGVEYLNEFVPKNTCCRKCRVLRSYC